jgi:hypothetical protein
MDISLHLKQVFDKFLLIFNKSPDYYIATEIECFINCKYNSLNLNSEKYNKFSSSDLKKDIQNTRIYSSNFKINYEFSNKIDHSKLLEKLQSRFKNSQIMYKISNLENKFNYNFLVKNKKRINFSSMKSIKFEDRIPIVRSINDKIYYSKLSSTDYIDKKMEFKQLLLNFIKTPSQPLCNSISKLLKQYLLTPIKIVIHSEYLLSSIMFVYILELGIESNWNEFYIFSIDWKMEELTKNNNDKTIEINNFRCDLVVISKEKVFIFEYKYRYDRVNSQVDKAMECIKSKNYSQRVLDFFVRNYKDISNKIKTVIEVGLGYSIKKNEINCELKMNERKVKSRNEFLKRKRNNNTEEKSFKIA